MNVSKTVLCAMIFFCGISLRSYASSESLMATYLLQKKRQVLQEESCLHDHAFDLRLLIHVCQNPKTLAEKEKSESYINLVRAWRNIPTQDKSGVLYLIHDPQERQIVFNALLLCKEIKTSDV